ncbi:MAG TPA: beta-galactosidase [Bacteroidales bacterium]|nr:beta-galactosidase [Bacteroidales bacterium]
MKNLFVAFLLICIGFSLHAQKANPSDYIGDSKLYYGVSYYPEAYFLEGVEEDIRQMKKFHINVVRMAEFSWALMEPREGEYDFQWLHDIVEKLHNNGIDVILGTPTATPPVWMAEKYPEIFIVDEDGTRRGHGARRNCSYTNPAYREFSQKIVLRMAKEFGDKSGVIGWQTDNEFNLIHDYSKFTKVRWHDWLKEKYNNIDNLNRLWHTNLWSQRYQKFEQIPMPRSNIWHHTSLRVDWERFSSDMIVDYQKIHIEAIRTHSSLPITHDGMPGQSKDYPKLFKNLDYMAVNAYHSFQAYPRVQTNYDRVRGYGKGMHWLFETAPNNSGGGPKGQTWFIHQPEGAMRAALWMSYALGGQGAMFWLWKQQPAGQEMPHGAFMSAWGKPAANSEDLKQLGEELSKYSDLLMNAPVEKPRMAIFYSHISDMGLHIEEWSNGIDYYSDWTEKFYTPVSDLFLHRDVIHENVDIDNYGLLIAPLMPVVTRELSDRLEKWVKAGGTLVFGPMTGYRNEYWAAHTDKALGGLGDWTGININSRIPVDTYNSDFDKTPMVIPLVSLSDNENGKCHFWSEAVSPENVNVLAKYKNGMHDGQAAIVERKVGKGTIVFMGTYPGNKIYSEIIAKYAKQQKIKPMGQGDGNIVVVPRGLDNKDNMKIVVSLNNEKSILGLEDGPYEDIMTGRKFINDSIRLKPYDVMLLKKMNIGSGD